MLLVLDGAGWHKARILPVPERLRLVYLPPYTPECNPTEHIWDEVREKGFANRFFATLDAVEVGLKTQLDLLAADAPRLTSLTCFPWIRDRTQGNWAVANESLGNEKETQTCPKERSTRRNRS